MRMSESITEYAKAFCSLQKHIKQPLKDADNPFFKSKYVPLENVHESIVNTAPEYGLSYSQDPQVDENGNVAVTTIIMHTSGEWMVYGPLALPPDKRGIQPLGSAITYARRYALCAAFGIVGDPDDDGNGASRQGQAPQKTQKPAPKSEAKPTSFPKPEGDKITADVVKGIREELDAIAHATGKSLSSVMRWLCEACKVTMLENITVNQLEACRVAIDDMRKKVGA